MKKKILKSDLIAVVDRAYQATRLITDGSNADYIPYLADIDSDLFGVALTLPDGSTIERGDTDYVFGIESISKVHNTILVMKQSGSERFIDKIGANATGMPFNSIMAILLEPDKPDTPLVNSGAISAASMVKPRGDSAAKWSAIIDNMAKLSGSELTLIEELYRSESETNFSNRSIAWLLKNYNKMYDETEMSLDLYTRGCSMGVTTRQLSIAGATIAFSGRNPVTHEQVFDSSLTTKIVSLIATVGFYENTGLWMFNSGIPAKTGVGGGIMGVLPNGFGIGAFSPRLDSVGNSVRAQRVIEHIANNLNVSVFDGNELEIITD